MPQIDIDFTILQQMYLHEILFTLYKIIFKNVRNS